MTEMMRDDERCRLTKVSEDFLEKAEEETMMGKGEGVLEGMDV